MTDDSKPEEGETRMDALLRERTANRAPRTELPPKDSPTPGAPTPAPPIGRRPVRLLAGIVAVLLIGGLIFAVWGAYSLWMRGLGGEAAFRQHNLAGNAAVERGDYRKADDEYGQMIALRPRRVDGYLLRGISESREGLNTAAINDDTVALTLTQDPMERGDLLYNRGIDRANRGDQVGAVADYTDSNTEYARVRAPDELPDIPDREADNYRQRAEAHWQHKDYAQAIADSGSAIAKGHARPTDYGIRAKAEYSLGRDTAAQADFTEALRLDPSYLDGYIGLGNIADKHHQYKEIVPIYERATRAEPSNARFWGNLGWFQYEAGQRPQAIASDQRALSLDPNQAWVGYNLALVYAVGGQGAKAEEAYADALASSGPSDRQGALKDIHDALARQPGSATLRQALAQVEHGGTGSARPARRLARVPVPLPAAPRPPAAFASALGPEVTVSGYGIQPPKGYTLTQQHRETLTSTGTIFLWSGPKRTDGTSPALQVEIDQDDGSLAAHRTSRQLTQATLEAMNANHSQLTVSPVTACSIGGLPFAQGEWDGIGLKTGKEYQGNEFWLVMPSWIIHVTTHDAVPYSRTTIPLLAASTHTLRKM